MKKRDYPRIGIRPIIDGRLGGIGEFTIYDWGNGAASEAYNRIADHYPDLPLSGSETN